VERTPVPTPDTPLPNCYWVLPGRLLAGEHPAAVIPEVTASRLARLIAAGVNCFIDLTRPDEAFAYDAGLPASVDYLRRPITDHGVPAHRREMSEILAKLFTVLDAGKVVYLHCRAGIGRTNMVVGCLLIERGLTPSDALAELNRLWKQNARSTQWPQVPETLEQIDYVKAWTRTEHDPLLEPETLAAARGLRGRFQGALLGLATGDAVAAATQFGRPGRFTPVGDMLGGGPFELPRGGWSDDTAMTLCLAESLLECQGFDARDQVARYRRWQQQGHLSATGQCVGITAGTARAIALAQWRRQPFSGAHDPQAQDPEALSRVAAVALYFFSHGAVVAGEQAAEAARTTSQAPAVLQASRALAAALHAALCGRPKAAVLASLEPVSGNAQDAPRVAEAPAGKHAATVAASSAGAVATIPGHSAPAALAAAADVFAHTRNFRQAVLAAANLGGNSDVVAAVCGALAGAHYGADSIPSAWRSGLLQSSLLEGFADRLLTHALLELGG
jgi:ADP-ribosylglycohydrolase/protein-tyrosine phosphatase